MADDRPIWTPPAEPGELEARLRSVLRQQWPVLLSGAELHKAPNQEAPVFDVPGAPPMRMKIWLRNTELTSFGRQRAAVRAEFVALAAQEQQLWDVQSVAFIDRDTRAILDLRLRATINLRRA